jgi:DNA-binding MarR family transcriptional regulator
LPPTGGPLRYSLGDDHSSHTTTGERTTDIARRLGVSHPAAINAVARLRREALATGRPYGGAFLTEKGQALAKRVRVRHRLVVDLLRTSGVPAEAAEGIEHPRDDLEGIRSVPASAQEGLNTPAVNISHQ